MNSREEKTINELVKFIEQHADEITDEASQRRLMEQFMKEYKAGLAARKTPLESGEPVDADYYMELADNAPSMKKRMEYLQKAIELEPDNVDAQCALIMCSSEDKPHECMKAIEELILKETGRLRQEGYFDSVGDFWEISETRPLLRVHVCYLDGLIEMGMMHRAIDEAKEILKLCKSDRLGIRYRLMHLYAYLEDELHAVALYKQFGECNDTPMLFPLALLYYKIGDEEKAEEYLLRLAANNKDTKKFMTDYVHKKVKAKDEILDSDIYGCRPNTYDEFLVEMSEYHFLFIASPVFPYWALEHLPKRSSGKKS